jgi:dolichyl-diphosphooligosaccharide---protein glycosyltransferase
MAWWDYGYQITGIANRTTIADGNTWNHEHIALLGRCLTSNEQASHKIVKHLADYVLIWAGGGGDDLAKSPHMVRTLLLLVVIVVIVIVVVTITGTVGFCLVPYH